MLFALRTTLASFVALYLAFLMSMDDPKWAAMTVWIVAQQSRGMSRSKAVYRAGGTLLGAAVAVFLIALFGQSPELLLVGLATWIGCCVALATGLRNFRAYGAVLAGYTAAIIALDVAQQPGEVFSIALSRTTYILLGLLCEGVAGAAFSLSQPENDLRARLSTLVSDAARVCERAIRGESAISQSIRKLFTDALNVDTSAAYAAAVSSDALAMVRTVRYVAGAVLEQLTASQAISDRRDRANRDGEAHGVVAGEAHGEVAGDVNGNVLADQNGSVPRGAPDTVADTTADAVASALAQAATALPYGADATRRRDFLLQLDALRKRIGEAQRSMPFVETLALEGLDSVLRATQTLGDVIDHSATTWRSRVTRTPARFSFVLDRTAALVNGIRAFLAVLLAGVIWIALGWDSGAGFVTITGVVCALFATRPNPTAGSWAFCKGAFCASLVAAVCNFVLLPAGSAFFWLTLCIAPFLFVGGLALRNPRTAGAAAGFTIFVLDLIGPRNDGQADPTVFFNGALTLCGGIAFGAIIFHLIAPSDATSVRGRLHRSLTRDLERMAERPRRWSRIAWLGRIADSVNRQSAIAAGLPSEQIEADFRFTLAASEIGSSVMAIAALQRQIARASKQERLGITRHADIEEGKDAGAEQNRDGLKHEFDPDDLRLLNRIIHLFLSRMSEVTAEPADAARAARLGARRIGTHIAVQHASRLDEALTTTLLEAAYALQRTADALDAHIVPRLSHPRR